MMNKQEIYNYLKQNNIWHQITEHEAVFHMGELPKIDLPYPEAEGKNLFICDDKKRNYYLITVKGNKRVNLKEFKKQNNTRSLSFAKENELMDMMHLTPGSVTPFGILNDKNLKVQVYIDEDFMNDNHIIGIHPNDNTATVWLKIEDLITIIKKHGNQVRMIAI